MHGLLRLKLINTETGFKARTRGRGHIDVGNIGWIFVGLLDRYWLVGWISGNGVGEGKQWAAHPVGEVVQEDPATKDLRKLSKQIKPTCIDHIADMKNNLT